MVAGEIIVGITRNYLGILSKPIEPSTGREGVNRPHGLLADWARPMLCFRSHRSVAASNGGHTANMPAAHE